jgi:GDSL-like Lipase/Acylhydrolase family
MQSFTRWIALTAIALVVGAMSAAPAAAGPVEPLHPVQLALGDSWAFGFGGNKDPDKTDPTKDGYVPKLHEALKEDFKCLDGPDEGLRPGACPQLQLLNLAIAGATTREPDPEGTLIADEFPVAIPLLQSRNLNDNPRDDVEVVTLHTGGNDVSNPIIGACLFGVPALGPCATRIQDELAAYRFDLNQALSMLRDAAGGERIVIGTYDNGIGNCFLAQMFPGEAVPLADLVLEGGSFVLRGQLLVVPQGLHDIMRDVGDDYGVEVAEVYGDLNREKDWYSSTQVDQGFPPTDCLHPTQAGYDKVSEAFLEALEAP